MAGYLSRNSQTQHLTINEAELNGVVHNLDLDILTARLESNPDWGAPFYYQKLKKLLKGYFITCA